jgi:anti-sigma B factor antagonist
MTTFKENRREADSSTCRVIEIHGECGLPDIDELQAALEAPAGSGEEVVIGLEHCEFIDSMALAALVRERDRIGEDGGSLVMAAPTEQIRRVLEVSRLDTRGLVFDTIEEAVAGSGGPLRAV